VTQQLEWVVLGALAALGFVGVLTTWVADRAVSRVLGEARYRRDPVVAPAISVLRPVKGMDEGLAQNFDCLLAQRYDRFEILIGAADADDPALHEARKFAARHPDAAIRVLHCPRATGLNPKVSILEELAQSAANDYVLISDSNVRVDPGYLARLVTQLDDPRVGLVTNVLTAQGADCVGSRLEQLQLATFVARATLFAKVHLNHTCVVGKSMLFRLSDLTRVGGWAPVRDVLAEDYAIGNAFHAAGFQVRVASAPVATFVPGWPLQRFIARHLRWAQMRRRVSLAAYLMEPFLYPTPFLLALSMLSLCWGAPAALSVAALVGVAVRFCCDRALLSRLHRGEDIVPALRLSFAKDTLALAIWVSAWFRRTIEWRGNRFCIGPGSRLQSIPVRAAQVRHPATPLGAA
jgi:ceramide glucosyltransferase